MARESAALLVAGTTSDAGKSVVVTGLCRAFARRGLRVAPYKAQNMSNNSMVTSDGAEIGRAQWAQAVAARVEPEAAMNPVLLKPGSDRRSHVVVMGKPAGHLEAHEFAGGRRALAEAAFGAYDDLVSRFDLVVCEGAGSPAEINLRAHDYVNMGLAQHGGIATVIVGDIDRGGVFAAMHGTLALLDASDQALVAGFVVNKFRGEPRLVKPALDTLEALTGRPVLGVLPWVDDLVLDAEDSLALAESSSAAVAGSAMRVTVVAFPRISNFTDVDALRIEPAVSVEYVREPRRIAGADVVLLPGTRSTIEDLAWLRATGLADAVVDHARAGGTVLGVCGGFQMLGRTIADPAGIEGPAGARVAGLGLLDVTTEFAAEKVLRLTGGEALGGPVSGYEIHHGRVSIGSGEEFAGGARSGNVFGTMWHGSLEGDRFRAAWLTAVGPPRFVPGEVSFAGRRESQNDRLADAMEASLDLDALLGLATSGPPVMRVVRGGIA